MLIIGLPIGSAQNGSKIYNTNKQVMDAPSENNDHPNVQPVFPLFPSAGCLPTATSSTEQTKSLDWLKNESFGYQAAETVSDLQKKVAEYESLQDQVVTSRDAEKDEIQEPMLKKLRMLCKESEKLKLEKERDKKKAKKSKHKHKKKHESEEVSVRKETKEKTKIVPTSESFSFPPGKIFLEEIPGLLPEHAYRIERKRDKILWTYGCLCESHIARFRHVSRLCLGSTADNKIFLNSGKSKKKKESNKDRYYSKESRKSVWSAGSRVLKTNISTDENSYIKLLPDETNVKGDEIKGAENVDPFGIMDLSTQMYVQGQSVSESGADDSGISSGFQMSEILQKVGIFNKRLRETPKDVSLWMEFIKFQDHVFEILHNQGSKITQKEFASSSKAVIEKKLSIFAKALEANPSSLELKVGQLKLSEDVLSSEEVDKKWDSLLFVHSGNVQVWRYYLLHYQSKLSGFSVSRMTKLYHKCLKTLVSVMEGQLHSADVSDNLQDGMIDIFVQYCYFLQQSGHTEKAVASFQALAEFNIFLPPTLKSLSGADKSALFESFWDSSVPRFGEPGAQGWAKWMEEKTVAETVQPILSENTLELEEEIMQQILPKWEIWLKIENLRELFHWLPWRPDISKNETEEDCEDLDRLVLADDVTPVLFSLAGSKTHFRLLTEFVRFLGLDPRNVFLEFGSAHCSMEYIQYLTDKLCMISSSKTRMETGLQVDNNWILPPSLHTFLQQLLLQSSQVMSREHQTHLTLLSIHLETVRHGTPLRELSKDKCKELRKFVKNILKEKHNRNNLVLWNAYARLEWKMGKKKEAIGVLETALQMFSGKGEDEQYPGLCLLYQTYCDIVLGFSPQNSVVLGCSKDTSVFDSTKDRVISCLSFLADGSQFKPESPVDISGSQILKIRKRFQEKYSKMLENFHKDPDVMTGECLLHHLSCMATFDLCALGMDSALLLFDSAAEMCTHVKVDNKKHEPFLHLMKEEILCRKLTLVQNVFSTRFMPLGKLRLVLQSNLEEFPDNPMFLDCLVDVESRSHISGRLRRHFDKTLTRLSSPIPVIFAVTTEIQRQKDIQDSLSNETEVAVLVETGIVHRVRSLFERGLQNKTAEHCPLLWRLYIQFEVKFGSVERAKGIFYRSLQQCPWAKVLYKDAVSVFGAEQLQEVVDLMMEKEIRIQIPVEEVDILLTSEPAAPITTKSVNEETADDHTESC